MYSEDEVKPLIEKDYVWKSWRLQWKDVQWIGIEPTVQLRWRKSVLIQMYVITLHFNYPISHGSFTTYSKVTCTLWLPIKEME